VADCGHHLEDDFICVLSLLYSGEARVNTEVQAGPLYRVLGSPLYITCSVSGFRSENTDKHFEFRMTKPSNPNFEIQIISSHEDTFGYSSHLIRVIKNEITLKRLSPNSVRFEIKSLQKTDEGEYECTAVNLEGYSAKTVVKVIEDSLSVSSSAFTPLSLNEGEALTLTCLASSSTSQHTHLSVAWYLHKDGQEDAQPIISLNRDFTLSPGQGFERRHQAGLIRLDKWGEASYSLKMAEVEPSDQGRFYCQAQEWIQDPDGSWYIIIQKNAEEMALTPSSPSLAVEISAQPAALQEGQELMLSCNINTQDVEKRFFSVAWLKGSVELARIGPTGVLTVAPEYSVRQKNGELRAYLLKHSGTICLLPHLLTENRLSIKMQQAGNVAEGGGLHLSCEVDGVQGQLSVTWQHKSTPMSSFTEIISINQEGVTELTEEFVSRKVRVMRPAADNFTLVLDEVTLSDSGVYQCAVSERITKSKTHNQTQTTTVTVISIGKMCLCVCVVTYIVTVLPLSFFTENNLSVSKEDTAMNISRNQDFTIPCNINKQSSHESKFQVTWFWQKEIETKQRPIFTVYRNSIQQHRFGENVRLRYDHPDPSQFSLTFSSPGPDNSGLYFCEVEEWLPSLSRGWRKVAVEKSGHLNVSVLTEGRHVLTHLVISLRKNSSSSLWAESVPMNNKPSGDD
uniref:Ig-like domain-containing protein n=1 Tax=Neolamprologus brichardi TaxID=32507 RepID=A0A3Q4GM00_NEOBR